MGLVIAPEIGRTLYFHANGAQPYASYAGGGGPLAAKIVHVHGERMVNLVVWNANGGSFGVTSVEIHQPDDATADSAGMYAAWMPWTVEQARKRQQLDAAKDRLRELQEAKTKRDGSPEAEQRVDEARDKFTAAVGEMAPTEATCRVAAAGERAAAVNRITDADQHPDQRTAKTLPGPGNDGAPKVPSFLKK